MATLDLPAWGYGIRYNYGIFRQEIHNGYQVEVPDYWLVQGNPWEIERVDVSYPIRLYGHVVSHTEADGTERRSWEGGETILAIAYDNPVPGFDTYNTINLRLWKAVPSREFDLASFNSGDYIRAVDDRQRAESISSVLYPSDATLNGKELRLKQQYFFVSATIRDVLRRFKKRPEHKWVDFPHKVCVAAVSCFSFCLPAPCERVCNSLNGLVSRRLCRVQNAIQLNDTHPSIGIAELMRILVDEEGLEWFTAMRITEQTFAYTNHTILPEALEKWSVDLLGRLLPRHLEIIYKINWHVMELLTVRHLEHMKPALSIIEESPCKMVSHGARSPWSLLPMTLGLGVRCCWLALTMTACSCFRRFGWPTSRSSARTR
jgi:starch phosphorylase